MFSNLKMSIMFRLGWKNTILTEGSSGSFRKRSPHHHNPLVNVFWTKCPPVGGEETIFVPFIHVQFNCRCSRIVRVPQAKVTTPSELYSCVVFFLSLGWVGRGVRSFGAPRSSVGLRAGRQSRPYSSVDMRTNRYIRIRLPPQRTPRNPEPSTSYTQAPVTNTQTSATSTQQPLNISEEANHIG